MIGHITLIFQALGKLTGFTSGQLACSVSR